MAKQKKSRPKQAPVDGGYACPHCRQSLSSELCEWDSISQVVCPKCNGRLFIPPVSLRFPHNREHCSFVTVCPDCYAISNQAWPGEGKRAKCRECGTPMLVAPLDEQVAEQQGQLARKKAKKTKAEDAPSQAGDAQGAAKPLNAPRLLKASIPSKLLGEQYKLDALTCNPFWLLALPGDAPTTELRRASNKCQGKLRLRPKVPPSKLSLGGAFLDSQFPSDKDAFLTRLRLTDNARQRFLHALLWPSWEGDLPENGSMTGVLAGKTGQADGARAAHSRASAALLYALACEFDYITGARAEPPVAEWREALQMWGALLQSDSFWEWIRERICELGTIEVREGDIEQLKEDLPLFILSAARVFVEAYLRAGRTEDSVRLLSQVGEAPFLSTVVNASLGAAVRKLGDVRVEELIARAKAPLGRGAGTGKVDYPEFAERVDPILDEAESIGRLVCDELHLGDELAEKIHFDGLVKVVMKMADSRLDCNIKNKNRERNLLQTLITMKRLLDLPVTPGTRHRLRAVIEENYKYLYSTDLGKTRVDFSTCWFLPGEPASPEHSIVLPVSRITELTVEGHTWTKKRILIPRSALAASLHAGVKNRNELLKRHPDSPRMRELAAAQDDDAELRIRVGLFDETAREAGKALAEFSGQHRAASGQLRAAYPSSGTVADLERRKTETSGEEMAIRSRQEALRQERGCGVNALWRCYLPGVAVGMAAAGVLAFVPSGSAAHFSSGGVVLKLLAFLTCGIAVGGGVHLRNFGRWKRECGAERNAIDQKQRSLAKEETGLWKGVNAAMELMGRHVSALQTRFTKQTKSARARLERATSESVSFPDLKRESSKKQFAPYSYAKAHEFHDGTKIPDSFVRKKRIELINNMSDAEVTRTLAKLLDMTPYQINHVSSYEKRRILREAATG